MYDIIIIGAGASGMCAAISVKRKNGSLDVAIIESLPVVGKKILATGNGRCNLSNENARPEHYTNSGFASHALSRYGVDYTVDFFNSLGLYTYTDDEGRIYPLSNAASSVLDALRHECTRLGITVFTGEKVVSLTKNDGCFVVNRRYRAKKAIVACGGKASPSQGSDGSGYALLENFGHSIVTPLPALVQLTSDNKIIRSFKGLKAKGNVKVFKNEDNVGELSGEILFTEYGLSGIVSMDAQRILCRYLENEKCSVVIDFVPVFSEDELFDRIMMIVKNNPALKCENILSGFVAKKIGQGLIKCLYIKNDAKAASLNEETVRRLAHLMKNFRVYLTGSKGFDSAQITSGGADVSEFDAETMHSKLVDGLYCVGEILDVDAACGGYNLQWAFSSGMCAGESAASEF